MKIIPPRLFPLTQFGGVASLIESTHMGARVQLARNLMLRPTGGLKGIPVYSPLWAIGSSTTVHDTITALSPPAAVASAVDTSADTFTVYSHWFLANERVWVSSTGTLPSPLSPSTDYYVRDIDVSAGTLRLAATAGGAAINLSGGSGTVTITPKRTLTASDKTVALRVRRQGKNFLCFYNITNRKSRGVFYMGDDQTHSGAYDFTAGSATLEVLALRLDDDARWQGAFFHGQWMLGNGVDKRVCVQLTRTHTPGKWRQAGSNDRPAVPVVSLTPPATASNVQAKRVMDGSQEAPRASGVVLTFTAHSTNFPGIAGGGGTEATPVNPRIYVAITRDVYATSIRSTLTGAGTVASPYVYTIYTGNNAASSSNNAIVAFVNADTKVISILSAATASSDGTDDTGSWAAMALAGGSGTGASTGFSNKTVTVYARFWDAGNDNLGYEGISSDKSAPIVITGTSANDIAVTVTKNPAAGGGRFQYIRIYLQEGEDDDAQWFLVDPDNPIDNTTSGTATVSIGSETEMGQEMHVDQHQPLEGNLITRCKAQMWLGGVTGFQDRLYPSKTATDDEKAPEGASADDYELLQNASAAGGDKITALTSDGYRVHVHTARGITFLNPENPDDQQEPPGVGGAINASAIAPWTGGNFFMLSHDLQLVEFNGARYGKRDSEFAAAEAAVYVRERADETAIGANPSRVFMLPDPAGQMLWYWMPSTDGTIKGFAYDFLARGLVGEFDYPKVYAAARMEPERPEIVFADEDGNLFVWDPTTQADHGDAVSASAAFTSYAVPDTPPTSQNGYGTAVWGGLAYRQAVITELETGMFDFGSPGTRKRVTGVMWRTIPGSRALVEVTVTGQCGSAITRMYGDVAAYSNRCHHKIALSLLDSAFKIKVRVLSAEQKPWIIRDLCVEWAPAAAV